MKVILSSTFLILGIITGCIREPGKDDKTIQREEEVRRNEGRPTPRQIELNRYNPDLNVTD